MIDLSINGLCVVASVLYLVFVFFCFGRMPQFEDEMFGGGGPLLHEDGWMAVFRTHSCFIDLLL